MDNMSEQVICDFCQSAVKALTEEKKEEVMKCVGEFVYNPKIAEINKNATCKILCYNASSHKKFI